MDSYSSKNGTYANVGNATENFSRTSTLKVDSTFTGNFHRYEIVEEGTFNFTIEGVSFGTYPGSSKIPPCEKAELTMIVDTEKVKVKIQIDLLISPVLSWRLISFFKSIGLIKAGDKEYRMDWGAVVGRSGKAHFRPRTYTNKAGEEKTVNDVTKFLPADDNTGGGDGDDPFAAFLNDVGEVKHDGRP